MNQNEGVSAALVLLAAGYIDINDTEEDLRAHISLAAMAWNLASLPSDEQPVCHKYYADLLSEIHEPEDVQEMMQNIGHMVLRKKRHFPDDDAHFIARWTLERKDPGHVIVCWTSRDRPAGMEVIH